MKFSENQLKFMRKIGLLIELEKISDSDIENIEEKVSHYLQLKGFDENYLPTEEGMICETILDMLD